MCRESSETSAAGDQHGIEATARAHVHAGDWEARPSPPPRARIWRMGTEVVVFLKVFFQDYCRLLGLPR